MDETLNRTRYGAEMGGSIPPRQNRNKAIWCSLLDGAELAEVPSVLQFLPPTDMLSVYRRSMSGAVFKNWKKAVSLNQKRFRTISGLNPDSVMHGTINTSANRQMAVMGGRQRLVVLRWTVNPLPRGKR